METVNKKPENTTYLTLLADRISIERPSAQIMYNTFLDIYEKGFNKGYTTRLNDGTKFKRMRKERQESSWDQVKTNLSDMCSKQVPINTNEPE